MTNFEHMSEEEKKLAIINGMHLTKDGEYKACPTYGCRGCKNNHESCIRYVAKHELGTWINAEYEPLKTENEKLCETLKAGEVIAVSDIDTNAIDSCAYCNFVRYENEYDKIRTEDGNLWNYGRKLNAKERGEE